MLELNYEERQTKNRKADWVQSHRLFKPLVDAKTWDAVQKKLEKPKRTNTPRSAAQYLAGLVFCGNCGARMVTGTMRPTTKYARKDGHKGERHEYFCGTYAKCCREKRREDSKCLRNGVFQDVLEKYLDRFLEETGERLELLTQRPEDDVASHLEVQADSAWQAYREGVDRLVHYLAKNHPEEYARLVGADEARWFSDTLSMGVNQRSDGLPPGTLAKKYGKKLATAAEKGAKGEVPLTPHGFVADLLRAYRSNFDPAALDAEIKRLDEEHTTLTRRYADLPTPRAKEKAAGDLRQLEQRIEELEKQKEDVSEVVLSQYRALQDLTLAVVEARQAMKGGTGERALRQRAESLRAVVQRIECTFTATGKAGGGWGKKNAQLTTIKIYPVAGDPAEFSSGSKGTLLYSSAHSRMNRTRTGRTR